MKYLLTIQRSWVLSRLAIEMDEMPEMYTKFNVETWVESAMRYFTSRNFRVVGEDGKVFGYGRSIWAMIDTESRQPTDIFSIDVKLTGDVIKGFETVGDILKLMKKAGQWLDEDQRKMDEEEAANQEEEANEEDFAE